jgi:hypothetical protein
MVARGLQLLVVPASHGAFALLHRSQIIGKDRDQSSSRLTQNMMAGATSIANVTATLAPPYQSIMSSQIGTAKSGH